MTDRQHRHGQIPLELSILPNQASETFLIGAPNKAAIEWLEHWPHWPGRARALNIVGPEGTGKTVLGQHFAEERQSVCFTRFDAFSENDLSVPHIALDGLEPGADWQDEALFHLYNWIASQNGSLLLLSRSPIAQMEWQLPDLVSRFATAAVQEIDLPDDVFLEAFLQQLFIQRQCNVAVSVLKYLLQRIPRNFSFAIQLADALDNMSLAHKKPVSVSMAKTVLQDLGADIG